MLSPEEVAHYHETGQVTPDYRLGDDVISAIKAKAVALFASRPDLDSDYVPNLLEIDPDAGWLDFAIQTEILESIVQLLGENIIVKGSAFFCKKGIAGRKTPWHQDAYYWPIVPMAASTAWIAFDHSTPENGCMRIIPGSHKERRVFPHDDSDRDDIVLKQMVSEGELPTADPADIVLEPGMVSFHDPFVLHGAEPNNSGARRGGLTFRYMPTTSYWDRELEIQQNVQGEAQNETRQFHLVCGIDVCGRNDIYRPRD